MYNPARSTWEYCESRFWQIQSTSYTQSGAKRRESLECPFGESTKDILNKIRREAPGYFPHCQHSPGSRYPLPYPQPAGEEGGVSPPLRPPWARRGGGGGAPPLWTGLSCHSFSLPNCSPPTVLHLKLAPNYFLNALIN